MYTLEKIYYFDYIWAVRKQVGKTNFVLKV